MKISMTVPIENLQTSNGFGQASYQIVSSLQRLGHEVVINQPAPVELAFCQPTYWQWASKDSYKIGYVPWESTQIPPQWKYMMRSADELWTPSQNMANWFSDLGYNFKVYQHGVDSEVWTPVDRRNRTGPVKLLHIGEPAVRKGARLTLDTFIREFGNSIHQATLTIKSHGPTDLARHADVFDNINFIEAEYSEDELVKLVHDHDVLVYPSYGEGFGLIPLQAMSTGMPVVLTRRWAPYESLAVQPLLVKTELGDSPWPKVHPGKMFHPDEENLGESMYEAVHNFQHYAHLAQMLVHDVHEQYNWDRLTAEAFGPVVSLNNNS